MPASIDVWRSPEALNLVKLRVDSVCQMAVEARPVVKEASDHVFQLGVRLLWAILKRLTATFFYFIAWSRISLVKKFTIAIVHHAVTSLSFWL